MVLYSISIWQPSSAICCSWCAAVLAETPGCVGPKNRRVGSSWRGALTLLHCISWDIAVLAPSLCSLIARFLPLAHWIATKSVKRLNASPPASGFRTKTQFNRGLLWSTFPGPSYPASPIRPHIMHTSFLCRHLYASEDWQKCPWLLRSSLALPEWAALAIPDYWPHSCFTAASTCGRAKATKCLLLGWDGFQELRSIYSFWI